MHPAATRPRSRKASAIAALAFVAGSPIALSTAAQASPLGDLNGATASSAATATSLAFGRWTGFEFGAAGSTTAAFTFFSDTPVLLRVTDGFCRGDEFRVMDRGFAIFTTTNVASDPSCDDEPNVGSGPGAWADPSYSKGRFLLQPGFHRVRIHVTESPFGAGGAFLRIDKRPVS